jgi:hypothetical protein
VVENGGSKVSWAGLTGSLFHRIEERPAARTLLRSLAHLFSPGLDLAINGTAFVLGAIDRSFRLRPCACR